MLIAILVALILAGVALWALPRLPLDATIQQVARVVIIVALVLYLLHVVFGVNFPGA